LAEGQGALLPEVDGLAGEADLEEVAQEVPAPKASRRNEKLGKSERKLPKKLSELNVKNAQKEPPLVSEVKEQNVRNDLSEACEEREVNVESVLSEVNVESEVSAAKEVNEENALKEVKELNEQSAENAENVLNVLSEPNEDSVENAACKAKLWKGKTVTLEVSDSPLEKRLSLKSVLNVLKAVVKRLRSV